jgi:hypothetical protein
VGNFKDRTEALNDVYEVLAEYKSLENLSYTNLLEIVEITLVSQESCCWQSGEG